MKVAALQFNPAWEDRNANYNLVRAFAREAKAKDAELLILPEMFATGFSLNTQLTAEPRSGETEDFLKTLARETDLAVLGGLVEQQDQGLPQNIALTIDRTGAELNRYAKIHLFSYGGEQNIHSPGDALKPFTLGGLRICVFICYDLRFPELFRSVVDECELMIILASWPSERQHHWDTLLTARAIENQCYVVGVNRVGRGGGLTYAGGSAILDPLGHPLEAAQKKETLIYAELQAATVAEVRRQFPFLSDRRRL